MFPVEKAVEELIEIYRTVLPGTPSGMNWWTNVPSRVATGMGFGRAAGTVPGAKLFVAQVPRSVWTGAQQAAERLAGPQTGVGYFAQAPKFRQFIGTSADWFKKFASVAGTGISGAILPPLTYEQGLALVSKPLGPATQPQPQGPLGRFFESIGIGPPPEVQAAPSPVIKPGGAVRVLTSPHTGRRAFIAAAPASVGPRTQRIRSQSRALKV